MFLLCAAALSAAQSRAAIAQPASNPVATRQAAAGWLERVQRAAEDQDYEGTFVYQRGSYVQSSRIVHIAAKGGEYEKIESLDGKPRTVLRHDDDLYTFVPERHLCVVERRQNRDSFPALLGSSGDAVLAAYEPKLVGADRVAGLDARVVELAPKDAHRYAYKLWVDDRTGLLLRSQTLDASGHVLEQIAFSQLQIGPAAAGRKSAIAAGMRDLAGWTVARPPVAPVDMAAQGWQIPASIAGFSKIREVRRLMAARDVGEPPIPVDQAVFTDGLATVSVFVEPTAHNSRQEGVGGTGATHVLVKRHGDFWITVLGEVPPATLRQFTSAIEYKASE